MNKENYHEKMEEALAQIPKGERLLLHSCCGPCSSAVLEQLSKHFAITLVYYNPNIWPPAEYERRKEEQRGLLKKLPQAYPIVFEEVPYRPEAFYAAVAGLEQEPEGGRRCAACFELRLQQAAQQAVQRGMEWFTTTLTISPHKNAALLNSLGQQVAQRYGLHFLPSDFKKKNGYKRSLELSAEYGMYRQDYCGCEFSHRQRFGQEE